MCVTKRVYLIQTCTVACQGLSKAVILLEFGLCLYAYVFCSALQGGALEFQDVERV